MHESHPIKGRKVKNVNAERRNKNVPCKAGWYMNDMIKCEGYIARQQKQVEQFKKLENKIIPDSLDYDSVPSLRIEARQKLKEFLPSSIGQASRISGVSPADISVLLVYMETL